MGRHALWRSRNDDPKTPLAWFFRSPWRATVKPGAACVYFGLIALTAFFASPVILLAVPAILVNLGRKRRIPGDPVSLATIPAPGPSFACRLAIERGAENAVVGIDEGMVTFVDGWLYYTGLRTEFSIRAKDVRGFGDPSTGPRLLLGETTVDLRPQEPDEAPALLRAARFWYHSSATLEAEPILPPREVHATGFALVWADSVRSGLNGIAVLAVMYVFLSLLTSWGNAYIFIAPFFSFAGDSPRKLRALKRMRTEDRQRQLTNLSAKPRLQ